MRTTAFICKACGKGGQRFHTIDHIEAIHLERISIPYDVCDKAFGLRVSLRMHKIRFHNKGSHRLNKKRNFMK